MKILIATGLYPPEIGGPATYAKLLENRLPERGIEVSVLPFAKVRHLPQGIRHIVYAWKLAHIANKINLILAQDTVSTGFPVAIVSLLTGKKFIVRVPGDYAWEQGVQRFGVTESLDEFQKRSHGVRVGLFRLIQRFVVWRAYRVIAPSYYLAKIISGWTSHPEKITVIYNGIEFPVPVELPKEKPDEFTIVSLGRLVPWKGMDGIIRVVAQEKNWHAVIVGDGPEREHLEYLAKELKCGNRVQLVGQLPRAQALGWVKIADVFVLNSTYEGLSHQLVEAMSLGVPIVATSIDGNKEVVLEVGDDPIAFEAALLVKEGLDYGLHNAIKSLEGDMAKAERLRAHGIRRAKYFSIEKTVQATAKLLLEAEKV